MGNAAAASRASPTYASKRNAPGVIGYKRIPKSSTSTEKNDVQVSALTPMDLQWKFYVKTYREGDPELPEDPAFPKRLVEKIQERDFPSDQNTSGAYIFYPDRSKPKMWVGQYRCLNPEDLLTCALETGYAVGEVMGCFPASDEVALPEPSEEGETSNDNSESTAADRPPSRSTLPPATCGLMRNCLQPSTVEGEDSEQDLVQNLRGGQSYLPAVSPLENQLSYAALQNSMKRQVAVATGRQFAHENLSSRLSFAQKLFSNDLPAVPVGTRITKGSNNAGAPWFLAPGFGAAQAAAAAMAYDSPYDSWGAGQGAPFLPCHQQSPLSVGSRETSQMQEQLQPCLLPPVLFSPPTRSSADHPVQPTLVR